jgi:hypothetical protein
VSPEYTSDLPAVSTRTVNAGTPCAAARLVSRGEPMVT